MKRRVVKIDEIREYAISLGAEAMLEEGETIEQLGIMALVDVEDMGWCKDDTTRWYKFNMNGEPCIYFNYGKVI